MLACTLPHLDGACPLTRFQELREIFDPLPAGCSLLVRSSSFYVLFQISSRCLFQAILDTYHSGTLLDLPHYHCNNVYVPWQSKGARRLMSLQGANGSSLHHLPLSYADIRVVRRQAKDSDENLTLVPKSIEGQLEGQWFPDEPSNEPPQIDTQLGERRSVDQREDSPSRMSRESPRGRELARTIFEQVFEPRPWSLFICDGWCEYSDGQYANIVSIGCAPQGRSDLILALRYVCQRARTCNAHGKAQEAR